MPESEKKMLTIYYIEDDESISYTIKEYLEEAGYKVCLFPTIAGAKAALQNALPALVLVDWNMAAAIPCARGFVPTGRRFPLFFLPSAAIPAIWFRASKAARTTTW